LNILDRTEIDLAGVVYYIYASNAHTSQLNKEKYSVWSGPIKLKVRCGPQSVKVEEGVWPTGYNSI
jgi:hypothetical protein